MRFSPQAGPYGEYDNPLKLFIMTHYYVVTPFEVFPEEEFLKKMEDLARAGSKVMAIVFNCKDYKDFERKWFGEEIV